jgi:hypothetical protein
MVAASQMLAVLASGAFVWAAQPSPATGSPSASLRLPSEVTGHIECGPEVRSGTTSTKAIGDLTITQTRGFVWQPTATVSDPRLEGTWFISWNDDEYSFPQAETFNRIGSGTWRIENDEGAWQGSYITAGLRDGGMTTATTILAGEGGYEGLSVLLETASDWNECNWDVRGLIIEGTVPATPDAHIRPGG